MVVTANRIFFHAFHIVYTRFCAVTLLFLCTISLLGCAGRSPISVQQEAKQLSLGELRTSAYGDYLIYRVQPGDSLFLIGARLGVTPTQLAAWNRLRDPYTIFSGQGLIIRKNYKQVTKNTGFRIDDNEISPDRSKKNINSNLKNKKIQNAASQKGDKKVVIEWSWPAEGNILKYYTIGPQPNKGIDIAGNVGDPVKSAANGKVVYTGNALLGYGDLVIVRHDAALLTAYGHNRQILVKEGDYVKGGQKIAEIGSSGVSGAGRLHFEIRKNGKPVNPLDYLP